MNITSKTFTALFAAAAITAMVPTTAAAGGNGGWGWAQPARTATVDVTAVAAGDTTCVGTRCRTESSSTEEITAYVNTSPRATGEYESIGKSGGFGFSRDNMSLITNVGAAGTVEADASHKPSTAESESTGLIDTIGIGDRIVASQSAIVLARGSAEDKKHGGDADAAAGGSANQMMIARDTGQQSAYSAVDAIVRLSASAENDS